jgi:hypothetical protein
MKMNGKVSIEALANEIREKILLQQDYKILRSEDNKFKYIQFYESDLPSVAYKFDKVTYLQIINLILE